MTGNPLSGHSNHNLAGMLGSAVAVDGLADGDHIISPTLTNYLEGIHGNGIILEEDTAIGASTRNLPEDLPGICEQVSPNAYTVRVTGGISILDGTVYHFAGGTGSSVNVDIQNTSNHKRGTTAALAVGEEALVVVYISSDGGFPSHIYWEMGTPVATASNTYPSAPTGFLNEPNNALTVKQSVVLSVLRCVYSAGSGDLNISITESNDKRVFVRPNPMYLTPVTTGIVGATTAVANHVDLDAIHGGGDEQGNLTITGLGAIWQSYDSTGNQVLIYSARDSGGNRFSRRFFDSVLTSTDVAITAKSDTENIFVLTPAGACVVTPSGTFPNGYVLEIKNLSGANTVTFDGNVVATTSYGRFVYDGAAWVRLV